jgi:hypothetical protein
MPRRKCPCQAGDWVAVPLRGGGFAAGLVARMDGRGIALGYFFGPRYETAPTTEDVRGLHRDAAICVEMFGDLGLLDGSWTVVGHADDWRPEDWPVPDFGRIDEHSQRAWRARYRDSDLRHLTDEEISVDEARPLLRDGLAGSAAVEIRLGHLLNDEGGAGKRLTPAILQAALRDANPADPVETADYAAGSPDPDDDDEQHAVLVYLSLSDTDMGSDDDWDTLGVLDEELHDLFANHPSGEFDGNEIGEGYWCLFFYGPDADPLADAVLAALSRHQLPPGSYLIKRYGDPGAQEHRINL